MALSDYLNILLAFLLYRPLNYVLIGDRCRYYNWSDMFGDRLEKKLRRLDRYFLNRWVPALTLTLLSLVVYPTMNWSSIDPTHRLRLLVSLAAVMLAWKSATMDIDLATGRRLIVERWVVIGTAIGVLAYPGFLFLLIFAVIHFFRGWSHHQHLQIRISLIFLATWIGYLILQTQYGVSSITLAGFFVVLVVAGSHYLVPGVGKLRLGPHWYSWFWNNRLHHLPMSAYMWGWCHFLPERRVINWLRPLRNLDRPLQLCVVVFEIGAAFALFDRYAAIGILGGLVLFHATVFILSGILFWQNFTMLTTLIGVLFFLPESVSQNLFGLSNGFFACGLMVVLPILLNLWRPLKLAWWDTPCIDRIDWTVEGVSGKIYGLYNDFLAPNDRLFGNESGYFLARCKRLTRHLGETKSWPMAKAIYDSISTPQLLEEVRDRLGSDRYDEHQELEHDRYMEVFMTNHNLGHPKRVCPGWMKAPGDQVFYWGRHPRFLGQERVKRLILRHREQIFDGVQIITLRDEWLKTIEIPLGLEEHSTVSATTVKGLVEEEEGGRSEAA